MDKDIHRLRDILDSVENINNFVIDIEFEEFNESMIHKSAVMAQLLMIGEAVSHITDYTKEKYPYVEWSKAKNMRNFLIHEYFGIEWEIVWDTINDDLPGFKKQIEEVLESEDKSKS